MSIFPMQRLNASIVPKPASPQRRARPAPSSSSTSAVADAIAESRIGQSRDIRMDEATPNLLRPQSFFPDADIAVDRHIAMWDPNNLWPADTLDQVVAGERCPASTTRVLHGTEARPFVVVHHLWLRCSDGKTCVVSHIKADANHNKGAATALMLLEASGNAAIVGGGFNDRYMHKRVHEFCRQAAWRGPLVQLLIPASHPGRSDRLRRISWPRSLTVAQQEFNASPGTPWFQDLLDRLEPALNASQAPTPAQDSTPAPSVADPCSEATSGVEPQTAAVAAICLPQEPPIVSVAPLMSDSANSLIFHPARRIGGGNSQGPAALDESEGEPGLRIELAEAALGCAHLCFGLIGAAVIDAQAGLVIRSTGDVASVDAAAAHAIRCWPTASADTIAAVAVVEVVEVVNDDGQADGQGGKPSALDEIQWRVGNRVCTALPVAGLPQLLMLGIAHRDHSDPAQVRWQLKVAANQLAHRIPAA